MSAPLPDAGAKAPAPRASGGRKVVPVAAAAETEQSLYEVRRKIYPRAVRGGFARWRWALVFATQIVFYGVPWLTWGGRQAVLFDLQARQFHIFGLVLWPQDFIYLAILLVISAFSLFLFTAVAGRLWCGYACPQTVYTEIFLWVERRIEGDRAARMKLDASKGARKVLLKGAKHAVWVAIALWTGFTFVGYFTPIRELARSSLALSYGPWETFWVLFYGFATYGNAGWMREQVCKYMCPYARFQSAMFDRDTLVITYDPARGEPRGGRSRSADPRALGLGDCVDCGICVQVCPTGIDIRNGLQYECIGCAACIDGCDQVMEKMGYPKGLIRYSTENALEKGWGGGAILRQVLRPRVLVYSAVLAAIVAATGAALWARSPIKMDVIRDRGSLAREVDDRHIENVYRLQIMNTEEQAHRFTLSVEGSAHLGHVELLTDAREPFFEIAPLATREVAVRVQAVPHDREGSQPITFELVTSDRGGREIHVHEKSRFIVPSGTLHPGRSDR
ncbi:MAG TPA: cytochrome c oxidase accessory protein CcoG [Usitatibacter sp.]|nr:cytochrome c oxidase accessory protein CcoG [Usitatibacter sp.]